MPQPAVRRTLALVLALASLVVTSGCGDSSGSDAPESEAPEHDHVAVDAAAGWLTSQLTRGLVHNDQYDLDDYGLTADVALALDAVGDHDATVRTISDQLARHVDDYTAPGFGTVVSAGGTAKTLLTAVAADADPESYGGTDLVAQLERTVATDGTIEGRVEDVIDTENKDAADYANVVVQALAVEGLDAVGSPSAASATEFLLDQQCEEGWFRLSLAADKSAADQTCDGDAESAPDVDATAYAVLALSGQDDDSSTQAVDSAAAWLRSVQGTDGSFANAGPAGGPNSNSTGLAGRALAEAGDEAEAEKAATWVAGLQLGAGGTCEQYDDAELGAIAYDEAALGAGPPAITRKSADQFRRATSGALPALQWLPSGSATPCG